MVGVRRRTSKKSPRWVGLDIGSSAIKVVELEAAGSGVRLTRQLIQELPVASANRPVDRIGWLQSALKECDTHEVYLALNSSDVVIRRVTVPPMSANELPEAVKWHIKDQLPFAAQDAVIATQALGEVWEKDLKKQDVLVAATSKTHVEELVTTVEQAGVRVKGVMPTSLALWASAITLVPEAQQGSAVLIDIGADMTHVAIVKDGRLQVVRQLNIGTARLTEALVGETVSAKGKVVIDRSRAEELQRGYGIVTESASGVTDDGIALTYLASLMRPVLEQLLTELSRLFDFYKVQMREAGVSRALLCGGGANLKQCQQFLADGLGITVDVLNPLQRITDRAQPLDAEQIADMGPRLAVAAGVALDHGRTLNVLSTEIQQAKVAAVSRHAWLLAAKGVAGLALACLFGLLVTGGVLHWQVGAQEKVWAQFEPLHTQYMSTAASRKALAQTLAQTQRLLNRQPMWDGVLKELTALVPANVELDEIAVHEMAGVPQIHLAGRVIDGSGAAEGRVSAFVDALEQSVFFAHIALASSQLRTGDTGAIQFEIEGVLE